MLKSTNIEDRYRQCLMMAHPTWIYPFIFCTKFNQLSSPILPPIPGATHQFQTTTLKKPAFGQVVKVIINSIRLHSR